MTRIKTKHFAFRLVLIAIGSFFCFTSSMAQTPPVWTNFVNAQKAGTKSILPDYSYSGYHFSEKPLPDVTFYRYFDVTDYGAVPNDGNYDDAAIQTTIGAAEAFGEPAVVFFPAGKFMVSSDYDTDKSIVINKSNIVLKGSGSGENGTELYMDKIRVGNGHWQFRFRPDATNTSTLTSITQEANRGDFSVEVASATQLSVGQSVFIHHQSEEFAKSHYDNLALNENAWTRLFGSSGGLTLYECHIIEKIEGNKITFKNPLQSDLPTLSSTFTIRNLKTIEGVGIEDIRFTSGWGQYPTQFVHHATDTVDYGWNAVQFKFVQNSWIRNCEFKDWTQVGDIRESIGVTVQDVLISGKRGHASWITRRNYGVLIKDCVDIADHHHGPGVGYSGVSTVYLRYKMSPYQSIDCHSGSPMTTLMDDVQGGDFHTNGGPWESYPHHGRYLTFWNFKHQATANVIYNFWSVDVRKPATYAEPFFVGFQPNHLVTIQGAGLDEMRGVEVSPKSLFEAQLALRLDAKSSIERLGLDAHGLSLSPNPFSDEILVSINPNTEIESVELYDVQHRKIKSTQNFKVEGVMVRPTENLPAGVYFVRIELNEGIQYLKVLKR